MIYNDSDPNAAAWLRELIAAGLIPAGRVDPRPIQEITPDDLEENETAHWFAGIGGWAYALKLAGWPTKEPIWSASLPCQPFSAAGELKGADDPRHLWPYFARLVAECRPVRIIGEQVASPAGRDWLAGIQADLEVLGYRFAAVDLCASSVTAPHARQRLFWVADTERGGSSPRVSKPKQREERDTEKPINDSSRISAWSDWRRIAGEGGKARRIKPGIIPLVNGLPARMGLSRAAILRGYGNAIVPQVAAEFIKVYMSIIE